DGKPFHVFEDEVVRVQLGNQPDVVPNERVPRIVEDAFANHREALAGRAAAHYGNRPLDSGGLADRVPGQIGDGAGDHRTLRKVELMDAGVDWIDFNRGGDVETRLLEPERHSSGSCEQIDGYRSHGVLMNIFNG